MTAELTGALDLGAAGPAFKGSPARSASVFLLESGPGTAVVVSMSRLLSRIKDQQLEPCRLWVVRVGGGMALRELFVEALSSVNCF